MCHQSMLHLALEERLCCKHVALIIILPPKLHWSTCRLKIATGASSARAFPLSMHCTRHSILGLSTRLTVNDILQQRFEPLPMRDGAPLYDRNAITL